MKIRFLYIFSFIFLSALSLLHAAEPDSYSRLREEEIQAKQARVEEFSVKIVSMQKQLEEDRKALTHSQEKLWQDFTQTSEIERKTIQEKMNSIEERQKLFENELARKRQEDEVRIKDKESEISRLSAQIERLRSEIQDDQKLLESYSQEERRKAKEAAAAVAGTGTQNEVLGNGAVKVSQMSGREMMGEAAARPRQVRSEYYIEMGDTLTLDVWRVPDLSRVVNVRPDGRISMPIVGDVDVVGLTLIQLKELLTRRLSEYIWNPQVSISVQTFGGRKFIILGEIKSPGVYRYQQDLSLVEAIALAGGFTASSKRGKIMIIRGDVRKNPQVKLISANLENVLRKGMLTENLAILPNDIIYLTKDFLGDYKDVIEQLIAPSLSVPTDFFVLRSAIKTAQAEKTYDLN